MEQNITNKKSLKNSWRKENMKIIKYTVVFYTEQGHYGYAENCENLEEVAQKILEDDKGRIRAIIPIYEY